MLARELRGIEDKFIPYERFVVCIRDAERTELFRFGYDLFGGDGFGGSILVLGYVPVLAKIAVEVTTLGTYG